MDSESSRRTPTTGTVPHAVSTILLSWLAMVGVDFFLHAGLLAPLYDWDSPFLLRPAEAFIRIPIGYLGFAVLAGTLAWLLPRFSVRRGRDGALIAGTLGAAVFGAFLLGLWSISTAQPGLLAGWWVGQTVGLGVGGFVIGTVLGGVRARVVASRIIGLLGIAAASAVVLQTIGYASAPVLVR
jgi:hypothetical protein